MKTLLKISIMTIAVVAASCSSKVETPIIGKQQPKIENGRMTPEVLWAFGRVAGTQVSPDGTKVLYSVSYYSVKENKGNSEIFVMNADGTDKKQITRTATREAAAKWMKDGKHIAFLSSEKDDMQLWIMKDDGSDRKQISDRKEGINDFIFSPDETKILFVADVKYGQRTVDKYPDLPKASGVIVTDLMYKHWDEWVQTVPHPFVADFKDNKIENAIDILKGEPFESPMKPFGGIEQLAWSPEGKTIAYTCRKKTGKAYALSTNSDIYFYNIETKKTENKTQGMMGYDQNPVFSPDGKWLAWESMEHDGYESDKSRLFIMNLTTGEKTDLSTNFDQNSNGLTWSADSKSIYLVSCWHALTQIYNVSIADKKFVQITKGVQDYTYVALAKNKLIGVKHSMSKPDEIYSIHPKTGIETELSFENKEILSRLEMGKVEERWITTTDNKQMLTWVIYPQIGRASCR